MPSHAPTAMPFRTDPRRCVIHCGVAIVLCATHATSVMSQVPSDGPRSAPERIAATSVQPGDRMVVKVYREPELSDTVMVAANGEIILARIGKLDATAVSIAALSDTVRARYGRFLRNPAIELIVLRRIAVNGEVARPDVYYVDIATTLRDVIARAGGITGTGSESHVSIIRRGQRIPVPNWQDDFTLASDLTSGDQIVVGKSSWLSRNVFSVVSSAAVIVSLFISLKR
jgi:protein involved in polysaccharide export with SLBB domain